MTAKGKAKELIDKMLHTKDEYDRSYINTDIAKQCALIAIKEMQEVYSNVASAFLGDKEDGNYTSKFLIKVEEEIKKS